LITTGAPPASSITSCGLEVRCAKMVTGSPMPLRLSSCMLLNLSRERAIATDSLTV
jgi:hypothetical protein